MPLLLRRSAPSPTVDELSFAARVPPLTSSLSSVSEASQSQRCLIHTSSMRRRSLNSTEAENSSFEDRDSQGSETASVDNDCGDQNARGSGSCTCVRSRRSQGSSKRMSTRLEDLAPLDDNAPTPEQENDTDDIESLCSHDRESACLKCEGSRDSLSSNASSRIIIRETQLAALDVELQNLRTTFTKSMYAKLSSLSRRLGKRNETKRITAA